MTQPSPTRPRDLNGRFKPDHTKRNVAIGAATAIGAVATALASALHFGLLDRWFPGDAEHSTPDLAADSDPFAGRAPDAFRPEGDAPVPAAEREGLRPPPGFRAPMDA